MSEHVAVVGIVVGVVGLVVLGLSGLLVGGRITVSREKLSVEGDAKGGTPRRPPGRPPRRRPNVR